MFIIRILKVEINFNYKITKNENKKVFIIRDGVSIKLGKKCLVIFYVAFLEFFLFTYKLLINFFGAYD